MQAVAQKILIMFVIMAVGFLCGKISIITPETNKKLSAILLLIVSPCLNFISYQREYSKTVAKNLLISLALAFIIHGIMILFAALTMKKSSKNRETEMLCIIFSNCAFIGIPLIQSVFGNDGVIYLTMYVTAFQILSWTYGVTLMTGENTLRDTLKHLTAPAIISVFIGLIFFFCRINLPEAVKEPINLIADMNTPLAMLIAGSTLAGTKFKSLVKKPRIIIISCLRLLVFPAVCGLLAALAVRLGADGMPLATIVIAAGCPTAVLCVSFAHRYEKDSVYASEIFAATTLLSALTIPLLVKFISILGVI